MQIEVHWSQLDQVTTKLDQMSAKLDEVRTVLDKVVLAAAASGPVTQWEAPASPTKRPRSRKATPSPTPEDHHDDEEHHHHHHDEEHHHHDDGGHRGAESHDDENTLRAQVAFEAKRITRTFGIGGMRAAIRKATGTSILQVDDVPAPQLPVLLAELQSL